MPDPYVPRPVAEAISRFDAELQQIGLYAVVGRVIKIDFPAAGVKRDVAHGLGVIPDGWIPIWADGVYHAAPGVEWTTSIAYLQAPVAGTRAVLAFVVLKDEEPRDA